LEHFLQTQKTHFQITGESMLESHTEIESILMDTIWLGWLNHRNQWDIHHINHFAGFCPSAVPSDTTLYPIIGRLEGAPNSRAYLL